MKKLIILTLTRLTWKYSQNKKQKAFKKFAIIEKNSAAQIISFLDYLEDEEDFAMVFTHAHEELIHSKLFYKLADSMTESSHLQISESKSLISKKSLDEFLSELAFISVSEDSVNHDFFNYKRTLSSKDEMTTFLKAEKDERHHHEYTCALLLKFCKNNKTLYNKYILFAHFRRFFYLYIHYSKILGEKLLMIPISIFYIFAGLLSYKESITRLHLNDDQNSEILFKEFNQQIKRLKQ